MFVAGDAINLGTRRRFSEGAWPHCAHLGRQVAQGSDGRPAHDLQLHLAMCVSSDGAAGIIKAIEVCFPRSARQRCLAHRMRALRNPEPGVHIASLGAQAVAASANMGRSVK